MDTSYKAAAKYFGEPTAKPEDFFAIIASFTTSFKKTHEDLINKKAAAAKAAEKAEKAEKAAAKKKAAIEKSQPAAGQDEVKIEPNTPEQPRKTLPASNSNERGGMDDMIAAIRAGAAFRRKAAS